MIQICVHQRNFSSFLRNITGKEARLCRSDPAKTGFSDFLSLFYMKFYLQHIISTSGRNYTDIACYMEDLG